MSKAILVMDMPENCLDCRFCIYIYIYEGIEACCEIMNDQDDGSLCRIIENYCQYRPEWCPLQTLPNEEEGRDCFDEFEDGYAHGWNSCIEEILG